MIGSFRIIDEHIGEGLTMVQAKPADTEAVAALLIQTAEWLLSRGSTQWSGLLTGEDSHNTAGAILNGDVFVCKSGTDIAGMVILMRQPSEWDRRLWESKAYDGDGALYLHRLAINRDYTSLGLGSSIIKWCEDGVRFEGKDKIRLDCIADNAKLNTYYSGNGYTYLGKTPDLVFLRKIYTIELILVFLTID
ncbi:GNAT family N-acetyltransferase [Paenibacillus sp. D2_2]|uniref:GNAT family N-acetyltransferase n=1 Tax=Paenibacillus sp. D2_2 TaxID=3073092 RepID=UPI00281498CA|nr:GNAT family N-acetyltransferase [Paenibacillus sp. D2_2]WMT38811.1 GNAT family N-acetyltransferase [Paenibacillus sp. D2_2]